MIRDLGPFIPHRAHKLNAPIVAMLPNGAHDRNKGRGFVVQVGAGTGHTGFPLLSRFRDDGWSGHMVERYPAQLDALHADSDRVAVLNLGSSDIPSALALHSLTPASQDDED